MPSPVATRELRVSIIGAGYVGLAQAVSLLMQGHQVLVVDHDVSRLRQIAQGWGLQAEPEIAGYLHTSLASGQLQLSANIVDVAEFGHTHIISVGTPFDGYQVDISPVFQVIQSLAHVLSGPGHVVIGRTTLPVGMTAQLRAQLPATIDLAWMPEFLREGSALADTLHPARIVVGLEVPHAQSLAANRIRQLTAAQLSAGALYLETNFATAEYIKLASNAYLSTRLSLMNAFMQDGITHGVVPEAFIQGLGADPRIGMHYLQPGLGFGGSCLPKDLQLLTQGMTGPSQELMQAVGQVNAQLPAHYVRLLMGLVPPGSKIALWGATFKPGTADIRNSPALHLAQQLQAEGYQVQVHDPCAQLLPPLNGIEIHADLATVCYQAQAIVVATAWENYLVQDPQLVRTWVQNPLLIDARYCLPAATWRSAGWDVQY